MHTIPIKTSIGVIVCDKSKVLIVNKRYTYAFVEFVHGKYTARNHRLIALINAMTREELIDVWSLNFSQMWYRIWMNYNVTEVFTRKKEKFTSILMHDEGKYLRSLITNSTISGICVWEVPKGRKQDAAETDLLCAVRELREETGMDKTSYKIIPYTRRFVSYIEDGVQYKCIYFIAIANSTTLAPLDMYSEISKVSWCSIEDIRRLCGDHSHLERLVAPALKLTKKYQSGKFKCL